MLFKVDEKTKQLKLFESKWRPKELEVESYLVTLADEGVRILSNLVFGEELLLISNQVKTTQKKRADILALDKSGNGVIVELKRDEGKLGVETQALQYLADFSKYRGQDFIRNFDKDKKLEQAVRGFIGDDAKLENINRTSRIILIARHFDETLFSMGEWLSEKGVAFRCISYQPVEVGGERFLSFSVSFDRSGSAVYRLNFSARSREPKIFWHNIGVAEKATAQDWWEFLITHNQIACGFENSPDDQGAHILSGYVVGDKIVAYATGFGAVGWGIVEKPGTYRIIDPGSADDVRGGHMRHRMSIEWKSTAKQLSDGIPAREFEKKHRIYHPVSTSVSMDAEAGEQLMNEMSTKFVAS